jgi:large subunit ribosomal protein L22
MEARAITKYVRMSPRKIDRVLKLIRGKRVGEALNILHFTRKDACLPIEKTLRSAVANLMQNEDFGRRVSEEDLIVKEVFVNQGPTLKRFRPMSMGRAGMIRRRTSHITLIVSE